MCPRFSPSRRSLCKGFFVVPPPPSPHDRWTLPCMSMVSTSTPWPGGFKCFTCEDVKDNYECNRWSADVFCPRETRYCFTSHHMDKDGESLSVTKRCVPSSVCQSVGCFQLDQNGTRECTACCEGNICNIPVPHNTSDAVFATIMLTGELPHFTLVLVNIINIFMGFFFDGLCNDCFLITKARKTF
uniref:LY6/PLAUR domain containing 6B n=1 Tax=Eptatretus burgeri TaxID=7764 RepID=A0A8C4QAI6_EPTBU